TYKHVIAYCNLAHIQHDALIIAVKVLANINITAVIAEKRRFNVEILSCSSQKFFEDFISFFFFVLCCYIVFGNKPFSFLKVASKLLTKGSVKLSAEHSFLLSHFIASYYIFYSLFNLISEPAGTGLS